ncbi:sugar dehydrogenase complex small subunit [Nocardioides sp. GCM10027113]|uniref:sugar dehydrogenase complex small subunit n=1 Tax=unclassified Nocardioides TaxID=2615069 RepID=UPI0036195CEF
MEPSRAGARPPDDRISELTRRGLLAGLATVTAGGLLIEPAGARARPGPVTLDEFMELSRILTDNEFSLDEGPGARYLASLKADPAFRAPLRGLVQDTVRRAREPSTFDEVLRAGALRTDAAARTAQQVLVLWYSGLVDGRTADYLEALAWQTLPFAEPASTKLGFPKWDEAP